MDALALNCVDYGPLTKLLDIEETESRSQSVFEVLDDLRLEKVLDGVIPKPGIEKASFIMNSKPASTVLISYLSKLNYNLNDFDNQMKHLAEVAVHLLVCTHVPGDPAYDFYLNHNLTFLNCVRILMPLFPNHHRKTLIRIYWVLTILSYITQQRPLISKSLLEQVEVTMTWEEVKEATLKRDRKRAFDAHFLKTVQILVVFKDIWPDSQTIFLKAANKFVKEFEEWTGFGKDREMNMNTEI